MNIPAILNTGVRNVKNVNSYVIGAGSLAELPAILDQRRSTEAPSVVYFVDHYFEANGLPAAFPAPAKDDLILYVDSTHEPKTAQINTLRDTVVEQVASTPCAIVGMGGGTAMDVAKAVSNLLTNSGKAEDYQGWDLVQVPGVFKIGIPTLSGTGAEATRTCVMTNPETGLKLGMNSDFTVYDALILDPELTATVPRNQYFYTGMDAYIHCMESTSGLYRNAIGDAYARETLRLCNDIFLGDDMMSDTSREALMVASYLGGCAIATSYVGVVHPFSAGLSVVLGVHHCVGNCIVMRAMEEFYPEGYNEFWSMVDAQNVSIPEGMCRDLSDEQYKALIDSTVVHEKPLTNALGENFRDALPDEKIIDLFKLM